MGQLRRLLPSLPVPVSCEDLSALSIWVRAVPTKNLGSSVQHRAKAWLACAGGPINHSLPAASQVEADSGDAPGSPRQTYYSRQIYSLPRRLLTPLP